MFDNSLEGKTKQCEYLNRQYESLCDELQETRKDLNLVKNFLRQIGLKPNEVMDFVSENDIYKEQAACCLKIVRDFPNTTFSPAGIIEVNKMIDKILK